MGWCCGESRGVGGGAGVMNVGESGARGMVCDMAVRSAGAGSAELGKGVAGTEGEKGIGNGWCCCF